MTIQDIRAKGLLLLECVSGSRAYGLDTEESDLDLKGVFYLPREQFYGLDYVAQVSNETNDEVYYELGRFVELLVKNNPNMLELLATSGSDVLFRHPVMDKLPVRLFLSSLCKDTFGGYALTQVRKAKGLNKKMLNSVEKERRSLLDFCFVPQGTVTISLQAWLEQRNRIPEKCGISKLPHVKDLYALFYDETGELGFKGVVSNELANEPSLSSIPKGVKQEGYLVVNQDGYSMYCREYREYWEWVNKRNESRYASNSRHGRDYDAKNMMHTIRLLQVAEEIVVTGELQVRRPNRDELLAVKQGKYSYDELLVMAGEIMERIELASGYSQLPAHPDKELVQQVLVEIRNELYQ